MERLGSRHHHGHLGLPEDDAQHVVEVVGDASGEPADGFQLLGLDQLPLQPPLLFLRGPDVRHVPVQAPEALQGSGFVQQGRARGEQVAEGPVLAQLRGGQIAEAPGLGEEPLVPGLHAGAVRGGEAVQHGSSGHLRGGPAQHLGHALRGVGVAALPVHLPEPVRGGAGDVLEAFLAFHQGHFHAVARGVVQMRDDHAAPRVPQGGDVHGEPEPFPRGVAGVLQGEPRQPAFLDRADALQGLPGAGSAFPRAPFARGQVVVPHLGALPEAPGPAEELPGGVDREDDPPRVQHHQVGVDGIQDGPVEVLHGSHRFKCGDPFGDVLAEHEAATALHGRERGHDLHGPDFPRPGAVPRLEPDLPLGLDAPVGRVARVHGQVGDPHGQQLLPAVPRALDVGLVHQDDPPFAVGDEATGGGGLHEPAVERVQDLAGILAHPQGTVGGHVLLQGGLEFGGCGGLLGPGTQQGPREDAHQDPAGHQEGELRQVEKACDGQGVGGRDQEHDEKQGRKPRGQEPRSQAAQEGADDDGQHEQDHQRPLTKRGGPRQAQPQGRQGRQDREEVGPPAAQVASGTAQGVLPRCAGAQEAHEHSGSRKLNYSIDPAPHPGATARRK